MSRNNTPSVLSSLTAYDSSDAEDEDESNTNRAPADVPSPQEGQVTLLMPPRAQVTSSSSNPPSREASPTPKPAGTSASLVQNYVEEEEDNFEFQRAHNDTLEEEETEQEPDKGTEDKENADKEESPAEEEDMMMSPAEKRRKLLMPPAPEGKCAASLEQKFAKMLALKKKGKSANDYIQAMKDFRNPSIYEKFIILCNIDENGTNFPDPQKFEASSYYDELEKAQRMEMERRFKEKERKAKASEGVKVDFIRGTLPPPTVQGQGQPQVQKAPSAYIRAFGNLALKM